MPANPRARNIPSRSAPRRRELSYLIAAILASGGAAQNAAAREVPFAEPPAISITANGGGSVIAADVDGDGDLDALSASLHDDKIAWYENDGNGGGWTLHTISLTADSARNVFAADVDGDGDIDALSASFIDNKIAWYENDGAGGGWTLHSISVTAYGAGSVFAADVDGDGDIDALSDSVADDKIAWYENDGAGGGWTLHTITLAAEDPKNVIAADVDGDGDLDVLATFPIGNDDKVAWFENDGTGGGWTERTVVIGEDQHSAALYNALYAADVDGDGDMDVLSAAYSADQIAWYENNGNGTSWTFHTISLAADGALSVFAFDVDGDGDVDALSASRAEDKVAWYENDGNGGGWTLHTISLTADNANAVFAADVDGDGDTDVLSASGQDDKIAWYRNDTIHRSGFFPDQQVVSTSGDAPQAVTAVDLDGDGDLDLVSGSLGNDLLAWHENDGTPADGGWITHTIATDATAIRDIYPADLDRDGDMDLAVVSSNDQVTNWYENDGTPGDGGWIAHSFNAEPQAGPWAVDGADFDRDGNPDLVAAFRDASVINWFRNDGTPGDGGWDAFAVEGTHPSPTDVEGVDLDGDGDADVVAALRGTDAIAWYENDGTLPNPGWTQHTITTAAQAAYAVVTADLDLDGDLDVISASRQDDKIAWYESDGSPGDGGWITHTISTGVTNTFTVFAGDLDNDGDVDIVSASAVDDRVYWFENDGTPGDGGWITHTLEAAPAFPVKVHIADVDGDGDLDPISASSDDDTIAWYENRGGQFGLPTLEIVVESLADNSETLPLLDIQALHLGRSGDSDAELATLEVLLTDGGGTPLTSGQANALIEDLEVWLDDGSDAFEAGSDVLVHTVSSFSLTAGVQTVIFGEGNANAQLPFGSPKVYFVVADLTADADSQTPSSFQVAHVTESSSTGEDAAADIPLTLEYWPDTSTGLIMTSLDSANCQTPAELLLSNRTVTTTVACEAGTFIRAGDAFVVGTGGNLSLSAGETIRFTSGFHVDEGTLTVTIEPALQP